MNNDSINNNKGDTKMNYKTVYSGYMCKQAEDSVKGASTEPASSETAYRQPDADPNKKYRYQLDNIAITSTKPMSLQDQAAVVNIADRRDAKVRNSINYLAALFALGGAGVLSKADKSEAASRVGGGMLGASLGGAAGYHGMRLAGYTRGPQLLAALLGALGGGVAGGLGTPKVIE